MADCPSHICALLHSHSCSFSYHTWQFIIFTFSTITACIISYSLRISFRTQDLALQQILYSIDLFLFYRTDYTDSRTMLNGCTGNCVRLSRPLVGFWTHFKSPHFHSFIHKDSFEQTVVAIIAVISLMSGVISFKWWMLNVKIALKVINNYGTSWQCSVVTMSIFCTVFEILPLV